MDRHRGISHLFPSLIALIGASLLSIAAAQNPLSSAPLADLPDLETLKTRLESAEAATATAPDDLALAAVRDRFFEAITLLEEAQKNEALAATFRNAIESAPKETTSVLAQLKALPDPAEGPTKPLDLPRNVGTDVVEEQLTRERATLTDARNQVADLDKEIAAQNTRPDQIRAQKLEAQRTITETEAGLQETAAATDTTGSGDTARILLLAKLQAAQAELAMLAQEELSSDSRAKLVTTQRDLAARQVTLADARVNALTERQNSLLRRDVNQAVMTAEQATLDAEGQDPAVQNLAKELAALSAEFEQVADRRRDTENSIVEGETALEDLIASYERLKTQLEIGGVSDAFGQIIIDQFRRLPKVREERNKLKALEQRLSEARLGAFRAEEVLRLDSSAEVERILGESADTTKAEDPQMRLQVEELLAKRTELLGKLGSEYQRLIRDLGELDLIGHQYVDKIEEVSAFLEDKRIWVRSAKIVGLETITELPEAFSWLTVARRLPQLGHTLRAAAMSAPYTTALAGLLVVALLALRPRFKARLKETGQSIKRISTDRYFYTLRALLLTLLLALPFPLLAFFIGTQFLRESGDSDWLRGFGSGMITASLRLGAFLFGLEVAREKGLGQAHFGWGEAPLRCFRRNLAAIACAFVPGTIVVVMTMTQEEIGYFDSLGRVAYFIVMGWSAFFLARMLHPAKGIFATVIENGPESKAARLSGIWYPAAVATPVLLMVLAAAGYPLTAFVMTDKARITIEVIFAGAVVYALLLRWFTMRERKLALAERLRDWKERSESAAAGEPEASSEEAVLGELERESLDFARVGEQLRRLLRFSVGLGVVLVIWYSWMDVVPAFRSLDKVTVFGEVSLAQLIPAILIAIGTIIAVRNVPGILEIAVLRHLPIDAGARHAILTLCQYAILATGFFLVFHTLELDWSKFGWIAAALSVGLGFGLQEVVANFVCGIILLFERPVRIGDVVTVAGTTGTVSRIQTRATTITNYDRQEFVVPNKEFVTGMVLNWTLTSSLNRVVVKVGVAYGSDTPRVREVLQQIAEEHADILDDPAPLIAFEEFADSTLNFSIRAYIPNLDNRLAIISDLHHSIHERFKEEGIEIAFPQRDLHLRSIDPSIQIKPGGAPNSAKGD